MVGNLGIINGVHCLYFGDFSFDLDIKALEIDLLKEHITFDEFIYANRPYSNRNSSDASKTSGNVQYTLTFNDDEIYSEGWMVPRPSTESKKIGNESKRNLNRYEILSSICDDVDGDGDGDVVTVSSHVLF